MDRKIDVITGVMQSECEALRGEWAKAQARVPQ
jgi:hypothetical protein